ncbi:hypothetical protein T01_12184 [Trichinella spiralis]|uniref:Uncharacterized protein n=1 Tax=Trichinella spiralis TaxID=6334 RepID=A0A0V1C117_TRISP|nr:hypothetical protein T01_12184 [Trichinella spiralis]
MVLSVRLSSFCSIENWFIDLRKGKEIPHSPDDSQRPFFFLTFISFFSPIFQEMHFYQTANNLVYLFLAHDSTILPPNIAKLAMMLCFVENFLHLNWKYSRSKDRWFDGTVGGFSVGGRMCSLHSPGWTNHVKDAFIRHGRMIIIVIMNVKISTNIITIQAS